MGINVFERDLLILSKAIKRKSLIDSSRLRQVLSVEEIQFISGGKPSLMKLCSTLTNKPPSGYIPAHSMAYVLVQLSAEIERNSLIDSETRVELELCLVDKCSPTEIVELRESVRPDHDRSRISRWCSRFRLVATILDLLLPPRWGELLSGDFNSEFLPQDPFLIAFCSPVDDIELEEGALSNYSYRTKPKKKKLRYSLKSGDERRKMKELGVSLRSSVFSQDTLGTLEALNRGDSMSSICRNAGVSSPSTLRHWIKTRLTVEEV